MLHMMIPTPVTLAQLHADPTMAVPFWVGGTPGTTETMPANHVKRLVEWAAISGYPDRTDIQIIGRIGGTGKSPHSEHVPSLADPPSAEIGWVGWNLRLTAPGLAPHDVGFWYTGYLIDRGTSVAQNAEWQVHATHLRDQAASSRAAAGHGPTDDIARATRTRKTTRAAADTADMRWRDTIRAAFDAGINRDEIAHHADISRERVYQIHDGRR